MVCEEFMSNLITIQANKLFFDGKYEESISLYKRLSELIGSGLFDANIKLCLNKINKTEKIVLTSSGFLKTIEVKEGDLVKVEAVVNVPGLVEKAAVVLVKFLDKNKKEIKGKINELPWSEYFKSSFIYLKDSAGEKYELFELLIPGDVNFIEIQFKPFRKTAAEVEVSNLIFCKDFRKKHEIVVKKPKEFNVAFIADEFTYNSFSNEFNAILIEPNNWKEKFDNFQPDLFFCESAWSGADSVKRPWQGGIYASEKFNWENRKDLLEILDFCKKRGIPTIFWNKEDPTHYSDKINNFSKTAVLFDYVFTSAVECVEKYKKDYGLKNVFALPFATNPLIFNPIENSHRTNNVIFTGSWYATHPDRCLAMSKILDFLIKNKINIEIYDRYYGSEDPNRKWPERFKKFIRKNVPHKEIASVYKSSKFGLNINTVTDSKTMFARRVFELMSSNTLVLSNYSDGIQDIFGDLVVFLDRDKDRLLSLDEEEIDKIRENALDIVLEKHTYKNRWEYILEKIGVNFERVVNSITIVVKVRTHDEALKAISLFQINSNNPDYKLLLVVHEEVEDIEVSSFYQKFNKLGIIVTSESHAKKYALEGLFNPIKTKYFSLIDINSEFDFEWIRKSINHFQYISNIPIGKANNKGYKFKFSKFNADYNIIVGESHIANSIIFENSFDKNIYLI